MLKHVVSLRHAKRCNIIIISLLRAKAFRDVIGWRARGAQPAQEAVARGRQAEAWEAGWLAGWLAGRGECDDDGGVSD